MERITLDIKQCLKNKLTMQETLIAMAVSMGGYKEAYDNMVNRGIISKTPELQGEWNRTIQKMLNIGETSLDDSRLEALALKVQQCFPKQRMLYSNGLESPFYFRCNKTEIKNKLKKFLTVYGNVPDEDIIDATERYVATYAPKGYRGMRLVKYFILKDDRKLDANEEIHVEQLSDLATFLENKGEEKADIVDGDEWLMNSRN